MGAFSGHISGKLFNYIDQNGKTQQIRASYGDYWEDVETQDKKLVSIFQKIDNGDGIIQAKELNLLNKLLQMANKFFNKTEEDNVLDQSELTELTKRLEDGSIDINNLENIENDENENQCWSEGVDRNIGRINISNSDETYLNNLYSELQLIGEEQGFEVGRMESGDDPWVEDSSIRRADNRQYVQYYTGDDLRGETRNNVPDFTSRRGNLSNINQGRVATHSTSSELDIGMDRKYYGTSYLEGGNVLNTTKPDGTPAAVIGEESIAYTLNVAGKDNTPENIQWAKNQIAEDLGLNVEDITFIPQYDFHVDMCYRPLHDGQFAVPDYDEAIRILEETTIPELENQDGSGIDESSKKAALIAKLREMSAQTKEIRDEAENKLREAEYDIVRIPCFATKDNGQTNFMNGIGGTSAKTGQSFYITNTSQYPELNNIVAEYFRNAGIDKVYFVSTQTALHRNGGIDCLTQELPSN